MQMRPLFSLLGIFMFCLFSTTVFADQPPIKFGKIEMEDLLMTTYEPDTSAPAVILCDYGFWSLQDYKFRKTVRIKILKPEGLSYGNYVYPSEEGTTIRGVTYNLENGEIVKEKVKGESIFKERIYEDYYNWRIAMPNVKVGSVIDIEITFWGIPSIWYFQKDIPVKYSELIIPQSMYIDYRKNFFGFVPLFYSSSTQWIAKDVPAFKSEPFMNSDENYITKYEFDVMSYHFPGYYREFTTDWSAVARRLNESNYFGGVLNSALYLNAVAKEIEESDSTPLGRMNLALEQIKKMKWNESKSFLSSSSNLGSQFRDGVGNSADINLVLVNLLQKLNIQATL